MKTVEQLVREECGDFYEQRRVLLLRVLAAVSDPDLRRDDRREVTMKCLTGGHPVTASRSLLHRSNSTDLVGIVAAQWRGSRGPRFTRLLKRAQWLVDQMSVDELIAFNDDVFRELEQALMQ